MMNIQKACFGVTAFKDRGTLPGPCHLCNGSRHSSNCVQSQLISACARVRCGFALAHKKTDTRQHALLYFFEAALRQVNASLFLLLLCLHCNRFVRVGLQSGATPAHFSGATPTKIQRAKYNAHGYACADADGNTYYRRCN